MHRRIETILTALFLSLLPSILFAENSISHGPILGRLSSEGVGVWARTEQAGRFVIRWGTTPDKLNKTSPPITTRLANDNTGFGLISGLDPHAKYYYAVEAIEDKLPGPPRASYPAKHRGSFRTLPDSEKMRDAELNPRGLFNFSFEFACGNNQNPGQGSGSALPAFKTMLDQLRDRIHFSIQNGDWLYESQRSYTADQWAVQTGARSQPHVVRLAPTICGVWQNYKHYLEQGENLANYHRYVPTFFTFDDHEILNDVWGAGSPGLRDRRAVFRDIGVQAWYDYLGWSNPVEFNQGITFGRAALKKGGDILVDPRAEFTKLDRRQAATLHVHWGGPTAGVNENELDGVGGDPNAGVYEIVEVLDDQRVRIRPPAKTDGRASYSIGRRSYYRLRVANCEFFVTDTRTHRQMHDTKQPDKPGLSILGEQQKKWLLEGMKQSDADFLFVVSSVNFMVPHVGGGKVRATNKDDAWTVFLDEREQLIRAWDALGKRVCVLTGDLHNSFVIKITDRVWEFASGPHNSSNHWNSDEGLRRANGRFKYGPRVCDIRWSTFYRNDIPRSQLRHPTYCVVQVNNVFNNPQKLGGERWVAFPRPHVVFKYHDGKTGRLLYAEPMHALQPQTRQLID